MSASTEAIRTPHDRPLPTPDERPGADVVIYDGHCRMCRAQVARLAWWDCRGRLAYLSLHDPEVGRRYPDLTHEALMREMHIVDRNGERHHGAGAIRHLARRLRRLWWLLPLLYIPFSLPLWQWLYGLVARNRYRISGAEACDDVSCSVHRH
jgi:predicted DCC family thiol-disulfide oxidoreductase YuxK